MFQGLYIIFGNTITLNDPEKVMIDSQLYIKYKTNFLYACHMFMYTWSHSAANTVNLKL